MAFSFTPTYQDYLNAYGGQQSGGSEGGQGAFTGLTPQQWAAMSSADQWNNLGGGVSLDSSDPRYAALAQQLGITAKNGPDSTIGIGYGAMDPRKFNDPKGVLSGDGMYAYAHQNLTPLAEQQAGGMSNKFWALAPLMVVGAGLAGAALGAGAGGTAGSSALTTGGFGTDIAAGSGTFAGAAGGAGAAAGTGAVSGGTLSPVESGGLGETGGLDPETASGQFGGMGNVADGGTYAGPAIDSGGSSNFLSQLNRGRQYFNGARSVMNALSGGQQGGQSGGRNMAGSSDILSMLFGGNGGGLMGGLLGLLANGHQAFGGGVGTASGAQDVANHASQLADPWGSSGQRGAFSALMTPDKVMSMLSQDPSAVLNNPAYKFDLEQGTNAINMGDAAQGTLRSGNRGYELEQYGQGLASKYGQQMFQNNLSSLGVMSNLAGVNAGSPAASAASLVNGFDNASNIRNSGINGLFSGGGSNPLFGGSGGGGLLGMLAQGGSSLWNWLSGGSGSGDFDMSGVDFGNLPDFSDTSGFNPSDFFSYSDGSESLADATGAFF